MTFEVILEAMKNLCLDDADNFKKFLKEQALNKKYIAEKDYFEILG